MVNLAFAIAVFALSILDVILTKAGAKAGKVETNPVMAWLQKLTPTGWPYVRSGGALVVAIGLLFIPFPISTIGLAAVAFVYMVVCLNNYDVVYK